MVRDTWTDPAHIRQWWGTVGCQNEICSVDLRAGGSFNFSMRAPDGTVYPSDGTFVEIVPMERLIYEGGKTKTIPPGGIPPQATVTVSFRDDGDKTRIVSPTRFLGCRH